MKKLPLYRYTSGNSTIDSPSKPDVDYIERARLVADEGMGLIKDGTNKYTVIDVDLDDVYNWYEVEAPELYIEDELI